MNFVDRCAAVALTLIVLSVVFACVCVGLTMLRGAGVI